VLTLAWMNAEAIEQTLATGESSTGSRSRQESGTRVPHSGHSRTLRAFRLRTCDADVLLLEIEQRGDVPHNRRPRSCFFSQ